MTVIDLGEIRDTIVSMLSMDDNLVQRVNGVYGAMYTNGPTNGIDVNVVCGFVEPYSANRVLGAGGYIIPVHISCVCKFRHRPKLVDNIIDVVHIIYDNLLADRKLGGIVNHFESIEASDDIIGTEDNPESYIFTITVNYIKQFNRTE